MIQRCQGAVRRHVQGRASGAFYVSPAGAFGTRPLRRVQRHAAAAPSRRHDQNRGRSAAPNELHSCRDERRMSTINDSGSETPLDLDSAAPQIHHELPRSLREPFRRCSRLIRRRAARVGHLNVSHSDGAGWAPCSDLQELAGRVGSRSTSGRRLHARNPVSRCRAGARDILVATNRVIGKLGRRGPLELGLQQSLQALCLASASSAFG